MGGIERIWEIDALRGLAVIMMVAVHVIFDLDYFAGIGPGLGLNPWLFIARLTGALFIFLAGISLTLSYSKSEGKLPKNKLWMKYVKRGLKIFCYGLLITVFTFFLFPQSFIFFGILHFIGLGIILSYPLIGKPRAALLTAIAVFALSQFISSFPATHFLMTALGFSLSAAYAPGFYTFDLYPLLPWLGVMLAGIFAGNLLYPKGARAFHFPELGKAIPLNFLSILGRHSLLLYFLHQPLLVGLIFLFF